MGTSSTSSGSPEFTNARRNFTKFIHGGATQLSHLSHAISDYLEGAGGGAGAARRMPGSTQLASSLVHFANQFVITGPTEALQIFQLEGMVGRPVAEVLDELTDMLCPGSGFIDAPVSRAAMLMAAAKFDSDNIINFEDLDADQLEEFVADVIAQCIILKVINEIATKSLHRSLSNEHFQKAEATLHDYTLRSVRDAIRSERLWAPNLIPGRIHSLMIRVFANSFTILDACLKAR